MTRRRELLKASAVAFVAAGIAPVRAAATSASIADVAIVGGGFAGVTAARELTLRGRTAVLVEARDRLGGRTHTVEHDGHVLELGGTWVHPIQPNVWAEITRYGLDVEAMPVPGGRQAVVSGGRAVDLDDAGMAAAFDTLARFCSPAAALFAAPYSERWGPDPEHFTEQTTREYIAALRLSTLARDEVDAMISTIANGPLDRVAPSEFMRIFALSGFDPVQMFAALSGTQRCARLLYRECFVTDESYELGVHQIEQEAAEKPGVQRRVDQSLLLQCLDQIG